MIPELILQRHPETGDIVPEVWKDINGFEGIFRISNYGRVKSLFRYTKNGQGLRPVKERIRSVHFCKTPGYWEITLKHVKSNKHKRVNIHWLVATHFIDNPENKPQVNHKDGDKLNAFVLNLEWNTDSENKYHAFRTGLKKGYWKGKIIHNARKVVSIKDTAIIEYPSITHLIRDTGYVCGTIYKHLDKGTFLNGHQIYSI